MTLSISDQPSQWRRITARHSLLTDATIDPFPYRTSRAASLLDHHIVRDPYKDARTINDDGRRNTVPHLPPAAPHITSHSRSSPPPQQLPASPDARAPPPLVHPDQFDDLDARKRSHQAMASHDHSEGSSSPTSIGHMDGSSSFCLCQPEPKIPRPRNAFILYRQHQQAAVVRANPGLPNPAISKIIGEQWSRLPEDAKNEWKALAEEEKARHAQQYPDYRYQPRRNGRYSSQSSGSGPPSGGKVDEQGNCVKCGGKTMNPPTTPYSSNHYPTTPRGSAVTMPRPGSQAMVSPPQSGRPSYPERHWPPPPPRYHDPRARYPSVAEGAGDGPDMKRRRYDGNGVYIPTREWREPPPYQYSPRATYFRGDAPPNAGQRQSMTGPPPPHAMYAPAGPPPPPPKLQMVRPPHAHKRDPSLTLPPLTTPSASQSSTSGLEAMIMSIPVLNKVKILSQISPHLPAPSLTSPAPEVRGSVVAIEGMDPTTVYSMTNSLAEELERDGKFAVRIFGGPDPYSVWSAMQGRNPLTIAETLNVIGEWHKISEEMRRFITTKFRPGSISGSTASASSARKSVTLDGPADVRSERRGSEVDGKADRIPHGQHPSLPDPTQQRPSVGGRLSYGSTSKATDGEDRPYTRIPAAAIVQQQLPHQQSEHSSSAAPASRPSSEMTPPSPSKFDTNPPPIVSTQQLPPTPGASKSPSSTSISSSPTPIPIALVPHYQLTTVDTAAITLPINDSYSPLAHWQWLATLWRGCIGPDVSIVIKGGSGGHADHMTTTLGNMEEKSAIAEKSTGTAEIDAARSTGPTGTAEETEPIKAGSGASRPSISVPPPPPNSGNSAPGSGSAPHSGGSGSGVVPQSAVVATAAEAIGQGVDVKLIECRAVVVRMGHGGSGAGLEGQAEFWEKAKRRVGFEVGEFLRR
ncbi:Repressor of filamentous growth 1 [Cyphellophora attinorum]|uniref:Repressor of filamentous growth 1 n=1 Tax=Cyphellophora attinorum TaxID=1664694 RepID=A0A0N1HUI7_9EURO|nr:Repressor of filamentous growth 1 [Phialophora attinorum]KPI40616.1 Repressor of filamentous growth 1 [Phialophora attinorum]